MSDKEHLQLIDDLVDVLYEDKIEIREFVGKTLLKDNTIDSMAHIIELKNKEMRELSNFLKERNITLIDLSPLVTVMDHVQKLEKDNNKFMKWWKDEARLNNKLMEERERHREAIERIKDNMPLEFKYDSEYESKKNVIRLINIQSEVDKALEGEE